MPTHKTYKQAQLYPVKCEQSLTNREPVRVKFQIGDKATNWLNLSPEEIETIYNMFWKEE